MVFFMTYDFPGSQKTHFYALGNNGNAAGHYQDSEGLFHGVVLEDGELRQLRFPETPSKRSSTVLAMRQGH